MKYFAYYLIFSWFTVLLAGLFLLPDEVFAIGFLIGIAVLAYMVSRKIMRIIHRKRSIL